MRIFSIICSILLLFCACGQTPPPPQQTGQPTQQPTNIKQGGTLNLCALRPDTFNPLFTQYSENRELFNLVFDSLITISNDFKPTPGLADEWIIAEQGKKLSLKLRQGVKWHDGSNFTAEDVEYTFAQLQDGKKPSIYTERLKNVQSIKRNGNYSIDIILKTPQAGFLNLLDFPIIKKGTPIGGEGLVWNDIPQGTGRYKISNYSLLKNITLTANSTWWGGKPNISNIIVTILPDYDSVMYSYNSRIIDAIAVDSNEVSKYSLRESTSYSQTPTNNYYFMCFNLSSPIFSNIEVRKAIAAAIDQEKLVKDVLMGFASPATLPINPNAWFAVTQKQNKSIQEVCQLLNDNGWSISKTDGIYEKKIDKRLIRLSFELVVNEENALKRSLADYISAELAPCGIKVIVKKVTFDEYQKRISGKAFDSFLGSVRLTHDYDLTSLLSTNGALNYGHFSNEAMDKAIQATSSSQNQDELKTAFTQLSQAFYEQQPQIPLAFENRRIIYDSVKLDGEFLSGFSGQYQFQHKWFMK